MGHANITTTLDVYAKAVPGWEQGAAAKLDAYLDRSSVGAASSRGGRQPVADATALSECDPHTLHSPPRVALPRVHSVWAPQRSHSQRVFARGRCSWSMFRLTPLAGPQIRPPNFCPIGARGGLHAG